MSGYISMIMSMICAVSYELLCCSCADSREERHRETQVKTHKQADMRGQERQERDWPDNRALYA